MQSEQETEISSRKREENLSPDGKWRSFPKVPHLLQYVSNGNYYGRIKIGGKLIRESLQTTVWTKAKVRLAAFLKTKQENRNIVDPPLFSEVVELFKTETERETNIKKQSKEYRLRCLNKIQNTWPELWTTRIDEITVQACKDWASKLHKEIAGQYFNNMVGTLNQVLKIGIKAHKAKGGLALENPAAELKRVRVKQKDLKLPESAHFKSLVENLRMRSGGWGPRIADLVEFLAYGGMRIHSEAMWVQWEDIDWKRREIIVRGDPVTATKNSEMRRVPIMSDMENLLTRMKDQLGSVGKGQILQVWRCNKALTRACNAIGIPKLTHHDLRHLFATRCIESGVDIPTVSRWLCLGEILNARGDADNQAGRLLFLPNSR